MLIPNLSLQIPSKNSKSKDNQLALERGLELWQKGVFEGEGKTIQAFLKMVQKPSSIAELSNNSSSLNVLTTNMENGTLPLNKDTFSKLL